MENTNIKNKKAVVTLTKLYDVNVMNCLKKIGKDKLTELVNLIEKMAIWYELRYPREEINKIIPISKDINDEFSDFVFNQNEYINNNIEEDNLCRVLSFKDFYNLDVFFKSLNSKELNLISDFRYPKSIRYVYPLLNGEKVRNDSIFDLDEKGYITEEYGFDSLRSEMGSLVGVQLIDAVDVLLSYGVYIDECSEIYQICKQAREYEIFMKNFLYAVLYRIMIIGNSIEAPRRALIFAKEFKLDLNIPMEYAIDTHDECLRELINTFLKMGGYQNIECYINYYNDEVINKMRLPDILKYRIENNNSKYTEEEKGLYKRLVNSINKLK